MRHEHEYEAAAGMWCRRLIAVMYRLILLGLLFTAVATAQADSDEQVLRQAVELHQAGQYAEAINDYQTYLKAHPEAAAVRSNLGAALAHEGRYSEATKEYTQALAAQPTNYGIRFNLGLAYYKMGNVDSAIKQFERVYSALPMQDPQRLKVALLLSECYLREGQDGRVIAILDPLADASSGDLALDYLLGTALLHQGQEERGALMIQRILQNGDTAQAHMLMAFTRFKANDKKGANDEVDHALALNPNLPEAYNLRGRLAFLNSDLNSAETAFRKALALDPNSFDARLWLGTLMRQQGRLQDANSNLERAMQLRPDDVRVRYQYALLCSDQGDDKKAAIVLQALIKDAPEYTEAHRSLSTIYFRLGRTAEGREQRKIAEAMDASIQAQEIERGKTLKK